MRRTDSRLLLPVSEAADRLGISYSTIKQWIYKGALRTTRTPGGHHRVAESEIDRLLASRGAPPAARPPRARVAPVIVSISGRNQLRGLVEEIRISGVMAQVRLRIGDQHLTAVITRDAVDELGLTRGDEALAIVKSTEVMIAREAGTPAERPARRRS